MLSQCGFGFCANFKKMISIGFRLFYYSLVIFHLANCKCFEFPILSSKFNPFLLSVISGFNYSSLSINCCPEDRGFVVDYFRNCDLKLCIPSNNNKCSQLEECRCGCKKNTVLDECKGECVHQSNCPSTKHSEECEKRDQEYSENICSHKVNNQCNKNN